MMVAKSSKAYTGSAAVGATPPNRRHADPSEIAGIELKGKKMNRKLLTALAIASICIGVAVAHPEGLGLGLMGGNPSGLSLKVWTAPHVAIDAGLGYALWYGEALSFHGDVLWHTHSLLESSQDGYLPLYIGLGARVVMANEAQNNPNTRIGIRIPFGLEYVFASAPIGLFVEVVPTFDLAGVPNEGPYNGQFFGPQGSVGFRYYFGGSSED